MENSRELAFIKTQHELVSMESCWQDFLEQEPCWHDKEDFQEAWYYYFNKKEI